MTKYADRSKPVNISTYDNLVFFKADDAWRESGIIKHNFTTKNNDSFKFKDKPDIVSYTFAKNTVYYSSIIIDENKYALSFKRVNCNDWIEDEIITINTDFIVNNEVDFFNPLINSRLFGLNERYAILAIPHYKLVYGRPFFEKMLLIDTNEKRTYIIPDKIADLDSLYCLDDAWIINDGEYIVFKTGRIRPGEKKSIWDEGVQKGVHEEYFDSRETIIGISIDGFIDNVKNGKQFHKDDIMKTVGYDGCLRFLENGADITEDKLGNLIFVVQSFSNNSTEIVYYDLAKKQQNIKKIDRIINDIRYFSGVFYSVVPHFIDGKLQKDMTPKKELAHIDIFDIFTNTKIRTIYDENLLYIDDSIIATSRFLKDKFKYEITLLDLLNGNKSTYLASYSLYFSKLDFLLIY